MTYDSKYAIIFLMIVVLDTNVIFQAMSNGNGASFFILDLVRNQEISLALSISTFKEYEDVLLRKTSLENFKLSKKEIKTILQFIAYIAKPIDPRFLFRPNLIDEDDNKFIELAMASGAEYLVTSNIKDFKNAQLKFDNFEIVTPAQFYKMWRKYHA